MGCKKSKAKSPERDEAKEIEERERAQRERLEKEKADQEAAERKQAEEEQAAKEAREKEEAERKQAEEEAERKRLEEQEAERRRLEEEQQIKEEEQDVVPSLDADHLQVHGVKDFDAESADTLSTMETQPQQTAKVKKVRDGSHKVPPILPGESVTPCDMTAVDQLANYTSASCGCYLGVRHAENQCIICKNMDLSDTPLLN